MKIQQLRKKIDKIDRHLLSLLEKRMKISLKIAKYKILNTKNIFDFKRENEILKTVKQRSAQKFIRSNNFLFSTIINVGKFFQYQKLETLPSNLENILKISASKKHINKTTIPKLGCLKTDDVYSKIAISKAFPHSKISNYTFISDLFDAINENIIDFGLIEINNSFHQSYNNIYNIISKNNTYICKILNLSVSYCLATHPKTRNSFKKIISTTQILNQCSEYIKKSQYEKSDMNLIFEPKFLMSKLSKSLAIICPKEVALNHNLEIIEENVQNNTEINKKFVVVSKNLYAAQNHNILSLSVEISNTAKFLNNISTYFSINDIKLINLQISQSKRKSNYTTAYLDITGNISDPTIISFINYLAAEWNNFQLLGYYSEEKF